MSALSLAVTMGLVTGPAAAKGLKALPAPDEVAIDGEPDEWDGDWRTLETEIKGSAPAGDLKAQVMLAVDQEAFYVAADVQDDKLVANQDHVEVLLGIPGGTLHRIQLYPGVAGKSKASARSSRGAVRGAKVVEAPRPGGYSLEAKIPWSAIPKGDSIRIGYRGAVFVHDADRSSVETIVGSTDKTKYADLPPISTQPELELGGGLLRERNIQTPPKHNLMADVWGDGLQERILVYDRFLVVLGSNYRGGREYYFRDLHADADEGELPRFEVKDYTGDRKADLLIERRVSGSKGAVHVLELLSYHSGEESPQAIFSQEIRLELEGGSIANDVQIQGSGARTRVIIAPGTADGLGAEVERVSNTGAEAILLPWGDIATQTYGMKGGTFALLAQKSQEPAVPPPPPPARDAAGEPGEQVEIDHRKPAPSGGADSAYALYKERRKVEGKPRFDVSANVAGSKSRERVVVHGRDLVVFGPAYKQGKGFGAITLSAFEKDSDIKRVTTHDVTRDGHAEVIIHGELRTPLPSDLGEGDYTREVVIIYRITEDSFDRMFAAEVGRRVGDKRIIAGIDFPKSGKHHIVLKPRRAVGYDERSYPWRQRAEAEGGVEPLLLPWGGIDSIALEFDGRSFVR